MTIQEGLYRIWLIAKREFYRLSHTPIYFFSMLIAPVISAVFFLSLMKGGLPHDLPIAVVDLDNSSTSRNLIRQLDAFQTVKVNIRTASFEEARIAMQKGEIYGIYFIPENFSKDAVSGRQPTLSFYTNGTYLIAASLLYRDMKTLSVLAGASVGLQTGLAKGYTEDQVMAQLQPITIDGHPVGNPWLNYSVYLNNVIIPAFLQLMIFLVTVFTIGSEIKYATSREWLRLGGNSITVSLLGKIIPQTLIFTLLGWMFASLLYGYYAFPLNSGWFPMLLAIFLLVVAAQSVGILMIGVLPTLRMGLSFASLFGMVSFSIVGFSYPLLAMHPTLQGVANLFPLRHYFLIYIDQALNGRELYYSWTQYVSLAAFLILPVLIGQNLKKALLYFKYVP
ncbi:MAG: ABC transporter permease [Tannerellaceae bacterium]|nr:ABC transporter permease [Tannerellaceae bacterium]